MRRILVSAAVLLAAGAFLFLTLGSSQVNPEGTYKINLDNAFGLVQGSQFKVGGVPAGTISKIDLPQGCVNGNPHDCFAQATVTVTEKTFGQFHTDAFCQSRPQSLIGEYFLDCDPGRTGKVLKPGAVIPVTRTQSTIPADLVQNIMRLPYRQRFTLIINELGAAVAGRSQDLALALKRADPALAETDNLLNLLANDAHTIRDLNASADQVITAMANDKQDVQRFVEEADRISTVSATQASNITRTWNKLPFFLEQLRPAMQKLGAAADAQVPVFNNLNAASSNLHRFFVDLVPFSHQSAISLGCGENGVPSCPGNGSSLGTVSRTGKPAVRDATPLVKHLNQFARSTPELGRNLAITLEALDARKPIHYSNGMSGGGPVEPDPRSPAGGVGYTGLEGVLQYAFNITNAISYFTPYGHELAVDAFANSVCSPYASPQSIANNIANYQKGGGDLNSFNPQNPRTCYAFLGPHQPGVTETDPTNPGACVPDPGGYPVQGYGTHYHGTRTSACKLQSSPFDNGLSGGGGSPTSGTPLSGLPLSRANGGSGGGGGSSGGGLSQAVGQIVSQLAAGSPASSSAPASAGSAASTAGSAASSAGGSASGGGGGSQTQQLLNYLLSP